jgi:tetratricopeptide (TPR) repeat protein
MYTQILKEILLTIDFKEEHIKKFITYCRQQLAGNTAELKIVGKLEREYHQRTPIWWYTHPCFLYSMLNRALRNRNVDIIIKLGFFIRDLHNQIVQLHAEQYSGHHKSKSFTVYRGQCLSQTDFDQLRKQKGGLLSFNHFLSTCKDRQSAYRFTCPSVQNTDKIGVLFVMKIDPSISSTPFANVPNGDHFHKEEGEILFAMHSVFRIEQITQTQENGRLWQVNMSLTRDCDPQLQVLMEGIGAETCPQKPGWYRLGLLLIKIGQFDAAQEVFHILLDETTDALEKADIYNQLGMIESTQGKYTEAIRSYEKCIKINQKTLPSNHPSLATSYNNIGEVYRNMEEYAKALSYYQKALEIDQKSLPPNHPSVAASYNKVGSMYKKINEYPKALSCYEKALEIFQKCLPPNHPELGMSYKNIGIIYYNMTEYTKALSYYEKALIILQKSLPANHGHLAIIYDKMGAVYNKLGDYPKALTFNERAFDIAQHSLPSNHPDVLLYKQHVEDAKKKL